MTKIKKIHRRSRINSRRIVKKKDRSFRNPKFETEADTKAQVSFLYFSKSFAEDVDNAAKRILIERRREKWKSMPFHKKIFHFLTD